MRTIKPPDLIVQNSVIQLHAANTVEPSDDMAELASMMKETQYHMTAFIKACLHAIQTH